ncbi:MAG: transcriptional regulator [Actinomycetota bacterium]|nr:transcriptional regulator [Actinomycetota bacterium]
MTHAVEGIDDVVHQRVRLGLLAILDELGEASFNYLAGELGVTAGNLSRHLSVLADAGYIRIDKTVVGVRPRTWTRITAEGRTAFAAEVAVLRELLRRHERSPRGDAPSR